MCYRCVSIAKTPTPASVTSHPLATMLHSNLQYAVNRDDSNPMYFIHVQGLVICTDNLFATVFLPSCPQSKLFDHEKFFDYKKDDKEDYIEEHKEYEKEEEYEHEEEDKKVIFKCHDFVCDLHCDEHCEDGCDEHCGCYLAKKFCGCDLEECKEDDYKEEEEEEEDSCDMDCYCHKTCGSLKKCGIKVFYGCEHCS